MIPIPGCRVLLAPSDGRLRSVADERTRVADGAVVAVLDTPGGACEIRASEPGWVGGGLVGNGHPVRRGAPVAWLARA